VSNSLADNRLASCRRGFDGCAAGNFPSAGRSFDKNSGNKIRMNSDVCHFRAGEEHILTSFTRRLIEIAALAGAGGTRLFATNAMNMLHLPAIALDRRGYVIDVNTAAVSIFDDSVKIIDKRLFVRDLEARANLKTLLDTVTNPPNLEVLPADPIVVRRRDKLPVILRLWLFEGPAYMSDQAVQALVTLNALGPKPGPPAAILAKTFQLTAPEAKLACIIARGAPLPTAARELNISREAARNQLKSIFAKTYTHRQSELVAVLLQVE
jgi:DNA-binding CsgD family transcriptional regulator